MNLYQACKKNNIKLKKKKKKSWLVIEKSDPSYLLEFAICVYYSVTVLVLQYSFSKSICLIYFQFHVV